MTASVQVDDVSLSQQVVGNTAGRDVITAGRDNIITAYLTGLRRLRPRPVDPDVIMPSGLFVKPAFFDDALQAIEARPLFSASPSVKSQARIVVLRAGERHGRRSAALRLLAATSIPTERVWELLPDWDTPDVSSLPEEPNAGYLLNLRGVTDALPNQFYEDLVAYAKLLRERGSYLVVTASPAAWRRDWRDKPQAEILVTDIGLPTPASIVTKFLAVNPETSARAAWLEAPDSVFFGILPNNSAPSEALRLAFLMKNATDKQDGNALADYHGWRDEVSQWFSGGSDGVETRAIRISGAILNGAPGSVILDCADVLLKEPEINLPATVGGLLARPDARARLGPADIDFDSATGLARLVHESQGPAILKYLWREHTQLSGVLTQWLQRISRGPARGSLSLIADSLTKLAESVGVNPILKLAEGWLAQGDAKSIELVGDLLSDLAVHETLGSQVRAELGKWASGKSQPLRQRAVARAISGQFGSMYPSQALTRARHLVTSAGSADVRTDAVQAVRSLISMPELSALVIDTLVKWISPVREKAPLVSADLFLEVLVPPSNSQAGPASLQVALSQEGEAGQAIRKLVVSGWLQVIRQNLADDIAARALLSWRRAAESGQLPSAAVVETITGIGRIVGPFDPVMLSAMGPDGGLKNAVMQAVMDELHSAYRDGDSSVNGGSTERVAESPLDAAPKVG